MTSLQFYTQHLTSSVKYTMLHDRTQNKLQSMTWQHEIQTESVNNNWTLSNYPWKTPLLLERLQTDKLFPPHGARLFSISYTCRNLIRPYSFAGTNLLNSLRLTCHYSFSSHFLLHVLPSTLRKRFIAPSLILYVIKMFI